MPQMSSPPWLALAQQTTSRYYTKISRLGFLTQPGDNALQFQKALSLIATASFDRKLVHMGQQDDGSRVKALAVQF